MTLTLSFLLGLFIPLAIFFHIKRSRLLVPITVISDCHDDNARGRFMTRLASLLPGAQITFIGVANEIEAALCLVDTLDALENRRGTIILNVAPRNGKAKRWPNGTPFGELKVRNAKIFATVDGFPLRFLAGVLNQTLLVKVYGIEEVVARMGLKKSVQDRIVNSQFRSFDFETRLVAARTKWHYFPYQPHVIGRDVVDGLRVGWRDNFGNLKLLGHGEVPGVSIYPRLKDVPDGELALVVGSSGLDDLRFYELVAQGGSASAKLGHPEIGAEILMKDE